MNEWDVGQQQQVVMLGRYNAQGLGDTKEAITKQMVVTAGSCFLSCVCIIIVVVIVVNVMPCVSSYSYYFY